MFCSKTPCNATSNAGTRERERERERKDISGSVSNFLTRSMNQNKTKLFFPNFIHEKISHDGIELQNNALKYETITLYHLSKHRVKDS